jgi:hypothetical protein
MAEFKVGRPKAAAALDALRAAGFDPIPDAADVVDPAPAPVTALHVVPTAPDGPDDDPARSTAAAAEVPGAAEVPASPSDVATSADVVSGPVSDAADAPTPTRSRFGSWPLVLIALGAFVSIWGGWVGLGELTGFGPIRLLPGIADSVVINSAITLPIGVEAYAAFALRAWLAPAAGLSSTARRFARWSAIGALALGAAGQIAYHLMVAAGVTHAPWVITAFVSCLPVVVLGCGAALTHLIHRSGEA